MSRFAPSRWQPRTKVLVRGVQFLFFTVWGIGYALGDGGFIHGVWKWLLLGLYVFGPPAHYGRLLVASWRAWRADAAAVSACGGTAGPEAGSGQGSAG